MSMKVASAYCDFDSREGELEVRFGTTPLARLGTKWLHQSFNNRERSSNDLSINPNMRPTHGSCARLVEAD